MPDATPADNLKAVQAVRSKLNHFERNVLECAEEQFEDEGHLTGRQELSIGWIAKKYAVND